MNKPVGQASLTFFRRAAWAFKVDSLPPAQCMITNKGIFYQLVQCAEIEWFFCLTCGWAIRLDCIAVDSVTI